MAHAEGASDAWNRLMRVEVDEDVRSESEYNGLTHRTVQRADTTGNGVLDQERRFTYDASWRIAEELIDDDFDADPGDGPDRRVQSIWGNRYIDDLILRRIDDDLDGDYDHDWYHLTDVQFSTVAVIAPRTSQNARIHERVTFDAYGRARHHWGHDVDGDGAITTSGTGSDRGIIQTIIATSLTGSVPITDAEYRAEADINRDGVISSADVSALGSAKSALAPGEISDRTSGTGPDSIIGWCGYVFIPETQFYHVRFRVYDTGLGRWKSRDPLGYVDGMGGYEYVRANTPGRADSSGLGQDVGDELPLSSLPDKNPADPQDCYVVGGPCANPELLERGSCAIGTGWQWKNQPGCNYCCKQHALCTACLVGGDAHRWSSQCRRRQGCRFKPVPGVTHPIGLEVPVPLSYEPDPLRPYCPDGGDRHPDTVPYVPPPVGARRRSPDGPPSYPGFRDSPRGPRTMLGLPGST
ncbi:MAG: hypothetical protein KF817_02875 [Phycisphaeraceae bacterium]|nr:hypothetical protein [Phycisphaeraceae bacterium]